MPEKQPAQDAAQTQLAEQPESTEQETESPTEFVDDAAPLGTHPMDGIIEKMTREEKVAQMFWVRCPDTGAVELIDQYNPAGYVLFARDFEDKTREEVAQTMQSYQNAADIPLLGTVDHARKAVRAEYRADPATEQPESTEQETEPTTESADDTAPLGTHPMDGIIEQMTLEQKVAQMFWVRCPDTGAVELIEQYNPAGYVLFARDFEDKTRDAVAQTVQSYQDAAYVKFSEQAYAVMIDHRTDLIDEMIDEINGKHYYGASSCLWWPGSMKHWAMTNIH